MNFFVLGLNHQLTPLIIRERFAFSKAALALLIQRCRSLFFAQEIIILSTCNRFEVYCVGADPQKLMKLICDEAQLAVTDVQEFWYLHHNEAALKHLMYVASGLDSMILGEPQVFGQVKDAYAMSVEQQGAGKTLHKIFQQCFATSKKIRTKTDIGKNPVSIAFAAVKLAQHVFSNFKKCTILMLGAGNTVELAAKHFYEQGARAFIFVNRTLERAEQVAKNFHGEAYGLADLEMLIPKADLIIAATDTQTPLVTPALLQYRRKLSPKTLLLLDLSVPRNIASELSEWPECYLYTIDDLQSIVLENLEQRTAAAKIAREMIDYAAENFFQQQKIALDGELLQEFENQLQSLMESFYQDQQIAQASLELQMAIRKLTKRMQHQAIVFLHNALKKEMY